MGSQRVGPDLGTEQQQQRNGKYLGKCKILFVFNFDKQMDYLKQNSRALSCNFKMHLTLIYIYIKYSTKFAKIAYVISKFLCIK